MSSLVKKNEKKEAKRKDQKSKIKEIGEIK